MNYKYLNTKAQINSKFFKKKFDLIFDKLPQFWCDMKNNDSQKIFKLLHSILGDN